MDTKESSASLCSLVGWYDNPIHIRFLSPTDCSKIPIMDSMVTLFRSKIHNTQA